MSQFVFILSSLERIKVQVGDASDTLPQRFIGEPGGSAVWKIENEHKKYKKARHKADCRGTFFGKGAIHFRMLYQFLASSPFLVVAPNLRAFSLLKHRLPSPSRCFQPSIYTRFIP